MAKRQYTIYLDMDGVIVDFLESFYKLTKLATGKSYDYNDFLAKYGLKKSQELIDSVLKKAGISFWSDMKPMSNYNLLVDYILDNFMEVYVLSSIEKGGPDAEIGKREWLRKNHVNIPMSNVITVSSCRQKKKYADDDKILIDDYVNNIQDWKQAGGIAIHHMDIVTTINQLKKYANFQSQNF